MSDETTPMLVRALKTASIALLAMPLLGIEL